MSDEFDFLNEKTKHNPPLEPIPEPPGPNTRSTKNMKAQDMADDVFEVYNSLGGTTWLLEQAKVNPGKFMRILEKMLPKDISLLGETDIQVLIADTINVAQSTLKPPPKLIEKGETDD